MSMSAKKLNEAPRLLPNVPACPFCGHPAQIQYWHGGGPNKRYVDCSNEQCDVSPSVTGESYVEAVAKWSSRK